MFGHFHETVMYTAKIFSYQSQIVQNTVLVCVVTKRCVADSYATEAMRVKCFAGAWRCLCIVDKS